MKHLEPVSFIHPNDGGEIIIVGDVFALMYLKQNATYALVGAGNAMVPVAGERAEILKKLKEREKSNEPTATSKGPDGKVSKHKGNKKGR